MPHKLAFHFGDLDVIVVHLRNDARLPVLGEPAELAPRSVEYGSYIIEAIETRKTFKFNGNVRNDGMITNLPPDCCAEGPMFADGAGLHRTIVGDLPPQCAAWRVICAAALTCENRTVENPLAPTETEIRTWASDADALEPMQDWHLTIWGAVDPGLMHTSGAKGYPHKRCAFVFLLNLKFTQR